MPHELHHSAVTTGAVNCFCLACDIFLQNREEALCHIKTSAHYESLSAAPYLEKFKDQYIRKFKTGYYCEFCNKMMQTTIHVNLHLSEEHHQQNRGNKLLKSLGRDVIAFDNVLIEERTWHGLIDNTCCICVTEFENEVLHKQNAAHALSLVQKPIKFGENDAIYRSIDDSSFHCITCNKLLPLSTMNNHFNDNDHLDLYTTCKLRSNTNRDEKKSEEKIINKNLENGDKNSNVNEIKSNTKIPNYSNNNFKKDCKEKVIDTTEYIDKNSKVNETKSNTDEKIMGTSLEYGQKNETESALYEKSFIDINLNQLKCEDHLKAGTSSETDSSKLSKTTEINEVLDVKGHNEGYYESSVDNNMSIKDADILQQISSLNKTCEDVNNTESDNSNPNINTDIPSSTDLMKTIATDNNITYNNSNNAFCRYCQVKLPFNLKSINEHIEGVRHKKKLMATQTKQSMVVFVNSLLRVQGRSEMEINSGYLINDKYYITLLSYLLLEKKTDGCIRCLLCGITLPLYQEVPINHIDNCSLPKGKHIQIITSEKDEFIREIQPDAFHCGFCHIVVTGWNQMQSHLRSPEHYRQKSESCNRFQLINLKLLERYVKVIEL